MNVYRLQNPKALETSLMQAFFAKVFPEDSVPFPGGFVKHQDRVKGMLVDPDYAFFAGVENEKLMGLSLVYAPTPSDFDRATFVHMHNDGSTSLRRALLDASIEFIKAKGHIQAWAVNATGKPDSLWARAFRRVGEWEKVGTVMKVALKDG